MGKDRRSIPDSQKAIVLYEADHTCCVCNERGLPVQIHHVDEDPSNNEPTNLAVLCLACHNRTQVRGGFGQSLNATLVIKYKDEWSKRVSSRREKADQQAVERLAGNPPSDPSCTQNEYKLGLPANPSLLAYAETLPAILKLAYVGARPGWASGITSEMVEATSNVLAVVEQIWVRLAGWYPENHFDSKPSREFFSRHLSQRFIWHRAIAEPGGIGSGGTIVHTLTIGSVLTDAESAVEDIVSALLWDKAGFDLKIWRQKWRGARDK